MIEEFKIYVVNLKRDKARRKKIINEIKKQNFKNYEIIDAVAGNELTEYELDTLTFKNKNKFNPWNSKMSPSQIGCALSHIKIYKKCGDKGTTVGGDHGKETVDIAVPFFVNALK